MDKMIFGYDDNLGLPNDFSENFNCEIKAYHHLDKMLIDFQNQRLSAIFIPAGTLTYVNNYHIIAQSLFTSSEQKTLQTNFMCQEIISVEQIPQMVLGRVNQYCTTSFWAPLIYLMDYIKPNSLIKFTDANSFQDMLHKTANGEIDCAMVWDIILKQNPADANKVHELFYKSGLPTPVIISQKNTTTLNLNKLQQFVSTDKNSFFTGFQPPDLNSINHFIQQMLKARDYFQIEIVEPNLAR